MTRKNKLAVAGWEKKQVRIQLSYDDKLAIAALGLMVILGIVISLIW